MENKKGQGMSTSTIILLILGLVILVVLVLGFSLGWNKITPWINTNNVDTIKTACGAACSTNNQYDFCTVQREVKDGINDKFKVSCNELATNQTFISRGYGIEQCPELCPAPTTQ